MPNQVWTLDEQSPGFYLIFLGEGLQVIVTVPTICLSGSRALQSQNWLRTMTKEVLSIYPVIEQNYTTSCVEVLLHEVLYI